LSGKIKFFNPTFDRKICGQRKKIKAQHLGEHVLSGKRALPFVRIAGVSSKVLIHSYGIDHCIQNLGSPVK